MSLLRIIYTLLLFCAALVVAPFWVRKMKKRGGRGTGLIERLGVFNGGTLEASKGADYYHAVSVGEVVMAIKVIKQSLKINPGYKAVIAVTTATGREIALAKAPNNTRVIYAPLDFPFCLRKVLPVIDPPQIILVDSELWVNLQRYAEKRGIPVKIINGRLSERSYERYMKIRPLIKPMLRPIVSVCTDGEVQVSRWHNLGMPDERIYDVGSLKFDFANKPAPPSMKFQHMINTLGISKPTIILSSTHPGEEKLLADLLKGVSLPYRLVVVPRHAERREEVTRDLQSIGYHVVLRSKFKEPKHDRLIPSALLVDSTGELSQWIQLADLVIMGKSWLKKGGQNPFESAVLGIPTVCGPFMDNFEPLFSELVDKGGAMQVSNNNQLTKTVDNLLRNGDRAKQMGQKGKSFLETKTGATYKTAKVILSQ